VLTHCLHYGTGVFEGIRAHRDPRTDEMLLFRAKDHFERMKHNVKFLNITVPWSADELVRVAAELIRRNGLTTDLYVRPLAYKSAQKIGVGLPAEDAFAMIALPMGSYLDTHKGLHCGISSWRRIQDNAIPCRAKICGAYVNSSLAAQEARDRGCRTIEGTPITVIQGRAPAGARPASGTAGNAGVGSPPGTGPTTRRWSA